MKSRFIKLTGVVLLLFIVLTGCTKDENVPTESDGIVSNTVTGNEGTFIEIYQGDKKIRTVQGNSVIFGSGQLLNGAYFRQFNLSNDLSTLFLRFSLGREVKNPDGLIYQSKGHDLREIALPLQETTNLSGVVAEMYMPNSTTFSGNASGTVTLQKDKVMGNGNTYKTVGSFEVTFRDVTNARFTFKGLFWKKD